MVMFDRFEGNMAVLYEDGKRFNVSRCEVPSSKEGDVLIKSGDIYITDKEETEKLRNENIRLMLKFGF